jgi:hypothetical protein
MMRTQATLLTRSGLPRLDPIFPSIRDRRKSGYQTRQDFSGYIGLPLAH